MRVRAHGHHRPPDRPALERSPLLSTIDDSPENLPVHQARTRDQLAAAI
jgi:hypothetical protein